MFEHATTILGTEVASEERTEIVQRQAIVVAMATSQTLRWPDSAHTWTRNWRTAVATPLAW